MRSIACKTNNKLKQIRIYDLFLVVVLFAFLPPQIVDYVIPHSRVIIFGLRFVSVIILFLIVEKWSVYRNQTEINVFALFVFLFALFESIAAAIKGDAFSFRYILFYTLFLCVLYTASQKKPILLIDEAIIVFGIYNVAQFISILFFYPRGMVPTDDNLIASAIFFCGGKNQAFIAMFIFLLAFTLRRLVVDHVVSKWTYIIILVFMIESFLIDSMASVACLTLFAIACLIVSTKLHKYIAFALNPHLLFFCAVVFFAFFCVVNTYSAFSEKGFLADIFHKYGRNLSFTGRTYIWMQAIDMFLDNPIIGGNGEYEIVGKSINQAHNAFLDVLSKCGLCGIVPYILLFYSITTILSKMKKNKKIYTICNMSFLILLVHSMFEFMDFYLLLFLCFLFIAASQMVSIDLRGDMEKNRARGRIAYER